MHFYIISFISIFFVIHVWRVTKDWLCPYLVIFFDFVVRIGLFFLIFKDSEIERMHSNLIYAIYLYIFSLWFLFIFFHKIFSRWPDFSKRHPRLQTRRASILVYTVIAAVISFLSVFIFGSYDFISWIVNPREGYQFGRKGVGIFYAMTWFFVSIAFIFSIYYWRYIIHHVRYISLLVILVLCYLMASKRALLALLLFSIIYFHYYFQRFKLAHVVISSSFFAFVFIGYFFLLSGSFSGLLEYFTYVGNTSVIFEALDSGELSHGYGNINLSRLWEFVPRILYAEKPFVFGGGHVTEFISPGKAEEGHNLGMLDFTVYFWDFGFFGIFLFALFVSSYSAFIYRIFLRDKNRFILFVLLCSLYSPIFNFGPNVLFLLIISIYINFS